METTKKCPYCGEEIKAEAIKCKHCGEWLNSETAVNEKPNPEIKVLEVPKKAKESLFKSCFWEQMTKHYCDFKGKVDRKTFWICFLYYTLIMLVISGISVIAPLIGTIIMVVVSLGLFLPILGLYVRRLRDIGKKWTWIFVILIPIVGPIWFIVLMAEKGVLQNNNQWTGKDTIITIVMSVLGLGLFFVPSSSRSEGGYEEVLLGGLYEDLDETDLMLQFGLINSIASNKPFSKYMDAELKEKYDLINAKEIEYGVNCDCLELIRQMESEHVTINPTECHFLEDGYAIVLGETDFQKYPNREIAMVLKYERDSSPFSKHNRINKVLVNDIFDEEEWLLSDCLEDWLDSEWYLDSGFSFEVDEYGNEYMIGEDGIGFYRGNVYDDEEGDYEEDDYETDVVQIIEKGETNNTDNKYVCIDGSELRLRLGPSTNTETFKWPDGTNRHPNVGDMFVYLGEAGDFYKIDFMGNELWVSKQYTHIVNGKTNSKQEKDREKEAEVEIKSNTNLDKEKKEVHGKEVFAQDTEEVVKEQITHETITEEKEDEGNNVDTEIFSIVDEMPEYPGGLN